MGPLLSMKLRRPLTYHPLYLWQGQPDESHVPLVANGLRGLAYIRRFLRSNRKSDRKFGCPLTIFGGYMMNNRYVGIAAMHQSGHCAKGGNFEPRVAPCGIVQNEETLSDHGGPLR